MDSTPTLIIPHLGNPCGSFSSKLPGLGTEAVVWEPLFGVAEGDGLLLLPSSSSRVPPSASLSLMSHQYDPSQLCWDSW